ncbi:hypothetical protein RUND412_009173 [Rhizina undulata]
MWMYQNPIPQGAQRTNDQINSTRYLILKVIKPMRATTAPGKKVINVGRPVWLSKLKAIEQIRRSTTR